LENVKDGAIPISHNAMAEACKIKEQPGKDIWMYGGTSLTDALMTEGLTPT